MKKGKLHVVATPIGNLSDITLRAIEVLKSVAFVLAEDTRVSSKLLKHYDINTQLISYRDQNHERMIEKVIEKLELGLDLALISDAGTPLISDPGYRLVKSLSESGYEIVAVAGASSVTAALSVSGVATDRYVFLGFMPKSDSKREKILSEYMALDCTLVLFESPNRVGELLPVVKGIDSSRTVVLANDLTKMYERVERGSVDEVLSAFGENLKGEFVVVISK